MNCGTIKNLRGKFSISTWSPGKPPNDVPLSLPTTAHQITLNIWPSSYVALSSPISQVSHLFPAPLSYCLSLYSPRLPQSFTMSSLPQSQSLVPSTWSQLQPSISSMHLQSFIAQLHTFPVLAQSHSIVKVMQLPFITIFQL